METTTEIHVGLLSASVLVKQSAAIYGRESGQLLAGRMACRVLGIASPLPFIGSRGIGGRNLLRVHFVEKHQPGAGDLVIGYPLSNAPLRKLGNFHYLSPTPHCFDYLACIHDA